MAGAHDGERERRVAANESLVRDVNERINESAKLFDTEGRTDFWCECADYACSASIRLTLTEYEGVRAHESWFVLVPGHETANVERIVKSGKRYVIVEKLGAASEVAREQDPRA